jgi:hypothetical protein
MIVSMGEGGWRGDLERLDMPYDVVIQRHCFTTSIFHVMILRAVVTRQKKAEVLSI